MNIISRKKGKKSIQYYYLQHSVRINGKIKKFERYLGKIIPPNIDKIEKELFSSIRIEKYSKILQDSFENFTKNQTNLSASVLNKQMESFSVEFTYNSQKIEGSSLSLQETSLLLEKGITPGNKPVHDVIEAINHNKILKNILNGNFIINYESILTWHNELFSTTKSDIAGTIRDFGVKISGSKFVHPSPVEIHPLLEEFFDWYTKQETILNPVELAGLAHLKFVTIHPFADGNGMMSRLIMNAILYQHNYPLINIKYKNRLRYYKALEKSQLSDNEHFFLDWFLSYYCSSNSNLK